MQLDLNQLCELLTVLDKTGISELTLKSGDLELTVRKGILASSPGTAADLPAAAATVAQIALGAVASPTLASNPAIDQNLGVDVADKAPVAPAAVPAALSVPVDTKWVPIISPMVGTFYRAGSSRRAAFCKCGRSHQCQPDSLYYRSDEADERDRC